MGGQGSINGWVENLPNYNSCGQVSQIISTANKMKRMISQINYYLIIVQIQNKKWGVWNKNIISKSVLKD